MASDEARDLVFKLWQIVTGGPMAEYIVANELKAAEELERYAAEQARKAREDEREACAERAAAWLEKPYALSGSNVAAHLRAAIKASE